MTFRKTSIKISSDLKLSKALKSSKSNNPTQKVRKSLKSSKNSVKHKTMLENNEQERGKSGVTPFNPSLPVNLYKSFILVYRGLKRHLNGFGINQFGYDGFMYLLSVYCFGAVGCSLRALTMSLHFSDSSIVMANVFRVVNRFVSYGLVNKVNNRFYISSHAEKIFSNLFTSDDIKLLDTIIRDGKRYDRERSYKKKSIIREKYFNDDGL